MIKSRRYIDEILPDNDNSDFSIEQANDLAEICYAEKLFLCQKDLLKVVGMRKKCDISMINVYVDDATVSEDQTLYKELERSLNKVTTASLRHTDQVFNGLCYGKVYHVILPGTTMAQIPVVIDKMKRALEEVEASLLNKVMFSYEALYSNTSSQ